MSIFQTTLLIFYLSGVYSNVLLSICDPNNRPRACTKEYVGVCGWYGPHVKCLNYPCALNSATVCTACSNNDVERVTLGDCPFPESQVAIKESLIQNSAITYPKICDPNNRPRVCTKEYVGVCGWFGPHVKCLNYPCALNSATVCTACSNNDVERVTIGDCPTEEMLKFLK